MNFLNLAGLWLLALLIPVILLYLLKLRREERKVSSNYLWQRMVRDMQANVPWQRLQRNLLLILQLLFLLVLIFAILRPFVLTEGIASQVVIMIFDTSASMAASDTPPSRLEAAKAQALQIVEELPDETRLTVIAASSQPRTLVSQSSDKRLVRQVISQITATASEGNLAPALQIAAAVAERQPDPQTILFSDGNSILPERQQLPGVFRFIRVGEQSANQAVQALSLQINPRDGTLTGFAQIANYSDVSVERRVAVYGDGTALQVSDLEIPARGEIPLVVSGIVSTTRQVEARLLPQEGDLDYLALDDTAYAVHRLEEPARVVLFSSGNLFLETSLQLLPALVVERLDPGKSSINPAVDLVIYDGVVPGAGAPDGIPPGANILFIAPPSSTPFFTVTGKIDLPVPLLGEPPDPIVEHLELDGVSILEAIRVETPRWARPLIVDAAASEPRPALLFSGEIDGRRIASLNFDLNSSDLPLQVAFPVLMSNLVGWLLPGRSGMAPVSIRPGTPVSLRELLPSEGSGGSSILTVTRPDGSSLEVEAEEGELFFSDTFQPGVYRVGSSSGIETGFAVNLFSPGESDIQPGEPLQAAGNTLGSAQAAGTLARQEWWRWAAEAALLLLVLEWLVYQRATLIKAFAQIQKRLGVGRVGSK